VSQWGEVLVNKWVNKKERKVVMQLGTLRVTQWVAQLAKCLVIVLVKMC
jgi:hypothetical protein